MPHGVSRWGADSLLGNCPLNGYPRSLHITPSFPPEVLLFSFNSWKGCPRTWKNTCRRDSAQVVFDLDMLQDRCKPVRWRCGIYLEYNMARNHHPRVQVVPFSHPQGCIPRPCPSSWGSGSRSSSAFAGLFFTVGHTATTGPPSSSWVPIVKTSLTILTTSTQRTLRSFQRIHVSLLLICGDRWIVLIPFL